MCVFRYKQIAAERLAIAGLHVAYGFKDLPTNGPFPINIALAQPGKVCAGCPKKRVGLNFGSLLSIMHIFDDCWKFFKKKLTLHRKNAKNIRSEFLDIKNVQNFQNRSLIEAYFKAIVLFFPCSFSLKPKEISDQT